jgi:hypothetical protein
MPEVTAHEPGVPSWLDLATSDPEAARAFYGPLLGWEFDVGLAETGFYTYCKRAGRSVAGMIGVPVETMPTGWTTYMATNDVEETARRMVEAGADVFLGPLAVGPAGSVVACNDPTGAVVGAWQGGEHPGAELVNESGSLVWSELATRDLAVAADFYSKVFGYGWDDEDTGDAGPLYRTFSVNGRVVGGAMQIDDRMPDAIPPHWMPYFGVGDVDASAKAAESLGGAVQVPPTDSPYGRWCVVADPQGGVFTVMQSPEDALQP